MRKKSLYRISLLTAVLVLAGVVLTFLLNPSNISQSSLQGNTATIQLKRSYYVSLCWYGLRQIGFTGEGANPEYEVWTQQLTDVGSTFGFKAPVAEGPLFQFLYQIPGYLDPKDPSELRDIFEVSKRFLKTGSLSEFQTMWPNKTRHWEKWFHGVATESMRKSFADDMDVASQALDIWADYMEYLWPQYRQMYSEKLESYPFEEYERRCRQLDCFEKWEEEFGFGYPYTEFVLVICPESPTRASSLGPEQVVFGSIHTWNTLRNSVIHEIGVRCPGLHRLAEHPATKSIMQDDYVGLLTLIETEVCYRKPRILPDLKGDEFLTGMGLEALVEWRAEQEMGQNFEVSFSTLYSRAKKKGLL